jgi:hypothetical protein
MTTKTYFVNRISEKGKVIFTEESNEKLSEIKQLPIGLYQITVKKIKSIRNTRYKYHFGHVLPMIVAHLANTGTHNIVDADGNISPIDIDSLHLYHKIHYCPAFIQVGNELVKVHQSTTNLSDVEFIDSYEEQIIEYYSSTYGIEFLTRQEFAELCSEIGGTNRCKNIIEMQTSKQ